MASGWAGKILVIDLNNMNITTRDTLPYTDLFIGGRGINVKVLFDEIDFSVDPFDSKNILAIGPGVLAGTPAPCSSRSTITALSPRGLLDSSGISGIVCIIDPFKFSHDEIERLKIYGDYMVPVKSTSSSMMGGNALYTVAGTLVQNMAQFLASLVITETMRPGTPVVYYITLQVMDMRNGFSVFNAPELMMARAAIAQLNLLSEEHTV